MVQQIQVHHCFNAAVAGSNAQVLYQQLQELYHSFYCKVLINTLLYLGLEYNVLFYHLNILVPSIHCFCFVQYFEYIHPYLLTHNQVCCLPYLNLIQVMKPFSSITDRIDVLLPLLNFYRNPYCSFNCLSSLLLLFFQCHLSFFRDLPSEVQFLCVNTSIISLLPCFHLIQLHLMLQSDISLKQGFHFSHIQSS